MDFFIFGPFLMIFLSSARRTPLWNIKKIFKNGQNVKKISCSYRAQVSGLGFGYPILSLELPSPGRVALIDQLLTTSSIDYHTCLEYDSEKNTLLSNDRPKL